MSAEPEIPVNPGDIQVGRETVENVLAVATRLWERVKKEGLGPADAAATGRLLRTVRDESDEYETFAKEFPIAYRWTVETGEFDRGAFEKFLRHDHKGMHRTRRDFLEAQAEYLVRLYQTRNPRAGASIIARYREAIRASVKKDDEEFAAAQEEAEAEVKRLDSENDRRRRENMFRLLMRQKGQDPAAAPPS